MISKQVEERKLLLLEARMTGGSPCNSLDSVNSLASPPAEIAQSLGLQLVKSPENSYHSLPPNGPIVSFSFKLPTREGLITSPGGPVEGRTARSTSSTVVEETLESRPAPSSHSSQGARSSLHFSPPPLDCPEDQNIKAGVEKRPASPSSATWYAQKRSKPKHLLSPQKIGELPDTHLARMRSPQSESPAEMGSPLNKDKDRKPQAATILTFFKKDAEEKHPATRWPDPFTNAQRRTVCTPESKSDSTLSEDSVPRSKRSSTESTEVIEANMKKLKEMEEEMALLKAELAQAKAGKATLDGIVTTLRNQLTMEQAKQVKLQEEVDRRIHSTAKVLEELLNKIATQEHNETRMRLAQDSVRLGKPVTFPAGHKTIERWEQGLAFKDIGQRQAALLELKEEIDKQKKALAKEIKKAQKEKTGKDKEGEVLTDGVAEVVDEFDLLGQEEALRLRLNQVKKDEVQLHEERKQLDSQRMKHEKELKRAQLEAGSCYSKRPLLHNRYVVMSLLGKGGFSEVWKGFDLIELQEVAIKIHQLNNAWSEDRKQGYIKHATREYAIHSEMSHPRVVRLYNVFEISSNAFATVLEYCKGTDLDHHLQLQVNSTLLEKDARSIIIQILSGLKYLNTPSGEGEDRRRGIIHYDLKPGNILFDEHGEVKITDFGLSKIMDDSCEGTSMELTSQGAGTYWYLPPECFMTSGPSPPRISSKVDVWSVGVIFFQMLFGKRPFGEGQTPDKIYSNCTILQAHNVEFPAKPIISNEAKEFIRACLTHNQADRPDVPAICHHSYIRQKKL